MKGKKNMTYEVGQVVETLGGEIVTILGPSAQAGYYNVENAAGEKESVALTEIKGVYTPSASTRLYNYKGTALEVVSNGLNYAILQKIMGKSFLRSQRTHAFVISDGIYELVGKQYLEPMVLSMLRMEAPTVAKDQFIQSDDFKDALKAIPVVLIQQVFSKLFQKKGWTTDILRNMIEAYVAMVASNVDHRLIQKWVSGAKDSRY